MLSRRLIKALRLSPKQFIALKSNRSSAVLNDRDPAPFFFDEKVQNILKTLIRPIPEIVFRTRLDSSRITEPIYKFMSDEELLTMQQEANERMWKLLQIPPFVRIRQEEVKILSKDPAITGYCNFKHVFTDITYGVSNKNRIIVVREPDGTLRTATHEERDRLNQIYFPIPGREVEIPKMFEEENLQAILDREDYEFILNRTCVQFDPDHPDYHRVTQRTFEEINAKLKFDKLKSTRHYGSLVFYLAWNNKIFQLLNEYIIKQRIEDAALLIKLNCLLHNDELKETNDISIVEYFVKHKCKSFNTLQKNFQQYCRIVRVEQAVQKSIKQQH